MAIFPDDMKKNLSPDRIMSKLIYFRDQAHIIHFNTTSFSVHKAMDGAYSELDDWVDKVGELLLGYIAPKRFENIAMPKIDAKKDAASFIQEVIEFSDELYEYGEDMQWWELSNFSADLCGMATKTAYLLTLS